MLVLATLLAVAVLAGVIGYFSTRGQAADQSAVITHVVGHGTFVHEVVERGEIESSRNTEIRCEVKARNSDGTAILEVVDEVRLDEAAKPDVGFAARD